MCIWCIGSGGYPAGPAGGWGWGCPDPGGPGLGPIRLWAELGDGPGLGPTMPPGDGPGPGEGPGRGVPPIGGSGVDISQNKLKMRDNRHLLCVSKTIILKKNQIS